MIEINRLPAADPCCMGWLYHAKCTCGMQSLKPGRRTRDGVTSFALDMPNWARESTRVIDGDTKDHHDPAEALLNDSLARLDIVLARQNEDHDESEHEARGHEMPLEATMGLMVIRRLVKPYELVLDFAPAAAEARVARLLGMSPGCGDATGSVSQ